MSDDAPRSPEELFNGYPECLAICRRVQQVLSGFGEVSVAVTKSQVALRRRKSFAFVWRPGQYVSSRVPAALSISLPYEITSDRFKEIAHPAPTVWMHHLELRDANEVDDQVCEWLANAYEAAS
jgi:Domain of unknown function (DUF5655)